MFQFKKRIILDLKEEVKEYKNLDNLIEDYKQVFKNDLDIYKWLFGFISVLTFFILQTDQTILKIPNQEIAGLLLMALLLLFIMFILNLDRVQKIVFDFLYKERDKRNN